MEMVYHVDEGCRQERSAAAQFLGDVVPANGMLQSLQDHQKCSIRPYELVAAAADAQQHRMPVPIQQPQLLQNLPHMRTTESVECVKG